MTVSQYFAQMAKKNNALKVFGIPSYVGMGLLKAMAEADLTLIQNTHEQNAAHMAEGYYLATRMLPILSIAIGPGLTNAVTGIANAYIDSVPMIVLVARASNKFRGRNEYHANTGQGRTLDERMLILSCTKAQFYLDNAENAASMIVDAFRTAISERPGPVLLSIPPELQQQELPNSQVVDVTRFNKRSLVIDAITIAEINERFAAAEKPLIVLGQQANVVDRESLKKLLAGNCPYLTTYGAKGSIPILPNYLGTAWYCNNENIEEAVQESDLILAIGEDFTAFSARSFGDTNYFTDKNIIQIHSYAQELGRSFNVSYALQADIAEFVMQVQLTKKPWKTREVFKLQNEQEFNTLNVIKRLANNLPEKSVFFADVGNAGYAAVTDLGLQNEQGFFTTGKFGVCGWSIPTSIGFGYAHPRPIFSLIGDLSFNMNIQELASIKKLHTHNQLIVFNNEVPQNIYQDQMEVVGKPMQTEMPKLDFEKLAQGYGLKYFLVKDWQTFSELKSLDFSTENFVIEVRVAKEDYPLRG